MSQNCEIIHNIFHYINGRQRYKFIVLGHELTCLIIFVEFGGHIFRVRRTHFSTSHLHSYRHKLCPCPCRSLPILIWSRIYTKQYQRHQNNAITLNLTFRYIDDWLIIIQTLLTGFHRDLVIATTKGFFSLISLHLPSIWHQWATFYQPLR